MANRSDRLAAALHQERGVVATAPATSPSGWGLGFYQNGEVLHKKRPQLTGPVEWEALARDVVSDCVVLHLRQPTVGDFRTQNTHPFRLRRWLFAHLGTIGRFEAIEQPLRAALPDFLSRAIRGTTDSELFFLTILSFLHDAGQLDRPDADDEAVLTALRSAIALVDRLVAEVRGPTSGLDLVLTNGRSMYAVRRGAPMSFVERRGLHDPPGELPPTTSGPSTLRYVMVVGEPAGDAPGWTSIDDGTIVVVDRNLHVRTTSL
ncbi:MAG: class II glutamine amidotransferase [Sandaracinus sp.]|nr:class II glutamine amidotransferase [Sandaracinus sp.]